MTTLDYDGERMHVLPGRPSLYGVGTAANRGPSNPRPLPTVAAPPAPAKRQGPRSRYRGKTMAMLREWRAVRERRGWTWPKGKLPCVGG